MPARLSVSLSPHLSMCELGCVADTQSMVLGIAVAEHDEDGPHSKLLYRAMMLMADFPLPLNTIIFGYLRYFLLCSLIQTLDCRCMSSGVL